MTVRMSAARLVWPVWGLCIVLTAVALVLFVINGDARPAGSYGSLDAVIDVAILGFPTVGAAATSPLVFVRFPTEHVPSRRGPG